MAAYYNENNPFAAAWLRRLIEAGHIAKGEVDDRSITDVSADDLRGFNQCHFFAGIGGWSAALRRAGWPDARPVWTGSCPCQPFARGGEQKGFTDDRHLWPIWLKLIDECGPASVFGEQSARAADWLRLVRSDMEALGYAVGAIPIEAASAGAFHLRDRFWFVAYADHYDRDGWHSPVQMGRRADQGEVSQDDKQQGVQWPAKPTVPLLAYGVSSRMERCSGFGNAVDLRPASAFVRAAML